MVVSSSPGARTRLELRWERADRHRPFTRILVVAGSVLLLARAALGALAHRWLNLHLQLTPRGKRLLLAGFGVLLLMLEIRQQLRADLLMAGTYTLWG